MQHVEVIGEGQDTRVYLLRVWKHILRLTVTLNVVTPVDGGVYTTTIMISTVVNHRAGITFQRS